jgi:pimeloyl-ACP methyl ester carboxylesterase
MLLLHGIRDLAWSMDSIAQAFCDRYRVIAPDLRGHGDSGQPGAYALPHFVADLRALVLALELERSVLVGHSLGGQIVSHYAGVFADDGPAAVVLIEGLGPPLREGESSEEGRRGMARSTIDMLVEVRPDRRALASLEAAVARVRKRHPGLDAERARRLTAEGTRARSDGALEWKWDPAVGTIWSSVAREQNEERWRWISCPTLVVTGARSGEWWQQRPGMSFREKLPPRFPQDELERRLACFRNARHVEIPDAGHMIHFDQPALLNQRIGDFLRDAT